VNGDYKIAYVAEDLVEVDPGRVENPELVDYFTHYDPRLGRYIPREDYLQNIARIRLEELDRSRRRKI